MKSKVKILYVEDDPTTKVMLRTILEPRGFRVIEAHDGLGGVDAAIEHRPDIVLMDINMPGIDGYEASTLLRGIPHMEHVPIVAYTAKPISKDDYDRMLAAGCDGFVPKTSTPDELTEHLETYLQNGRTHKTKVDAGARAYQQRLVEKLQDQINRLRRANEEQMLLNNVAEAINSTLDLDELLMKITQAVHKTFEVEFCSLLLLDKETGELIFRAAVGDKADDLTGKRLRPRQGIAGWVVQEAEPVLANDVRRDPRFFDGVDDFSGSNTRSIICVPLYVKEEIIGVIEAINKTKGQFDQDSLRLLESIAASAALAIENASLYQDLQNERDQLVRKEEEIRRSIARDLHDGPTQVLSAIAMNVDFIKKLKEMAPERVDTELDNLQNMATEAGHEIRTLLFGLHPIILETQGLAAALEVYVDRFRDRNGMELVLDTPPDFEPNISKESEVVAFIVSQEAVNNAKKHARAERTTIKLREKDDKLVVTVSDDGDGFDMKAVAGNYDKQLSFGLRTMQERASLVGGSFNIKSTLGEGTTVTLVVPIDAVPRVRPSEEYEYEEYEEASIAIAEEGDM